MLCFANSEDDSYQATPGTPNVYSIKVNLKSGETEWFNIYYSSKYNKYYSGYVGSFYVVDINQVNDFINN